MKGTKRNDPFLFDGYLKEFCYFRCHREEHKHTMLSRALFDITEQYQVWKSLYSIKIFNFCHYLFHCFPFTHFFHCLFKSLFMMLFATHWSCHSMIPYHFMIPSPIYDPLPIYDPYHSMIPCQSLIPLPIHDPFTTQWPICLPIKDNFIDLILKFFYNKNTECCITALNMQECTKLWLHHAKLNLWWIWTWNYTLVTLLYK